MGKASVRKNKNIYQLTRENLSLTREEASECIGGLSADRICRIETDKTTPEAADILLMARGYKAPHLCNYFCSCECVIGQEYIPCIEKENLPAIVLRLLSSLASVNDEKETLISITADGKIEDEELEKFVQIQKDLQEISATSEALRLWCQQMIAQGNIDTEKYNRLINGTE